MKYLKLEDYPFVIELTNIQFIYIKDYNPEEKNYDDINTLVIEYYNNKKIEIKCEPLKEDFEENCNYDAVFEMYYLVLKSLSACSGVNQMEESKFFTKATDIKISLI